MKSNVKLWIRGGQIGGSSIRDEMLEQRWSFCRCQGVKKSCGGRVLKRSSPDEVLCRGYTFSVKGSMSAVARSGLLSSERVGSGTFVNRHQQSLSLRAHLPLVIVATKAVAREPSTC